MATNIEKRIALLYGDAHHFGHNGQNQIETGVRPMLRRDDRGKRQAVEIEFASRRLREGIYRYQKGGTLERHKLVLELGSHRAFRILFCRYYPPDQGRTGFSELTYSYGGFTDFWTTSEHCFNSGCVHPLAPNFDLAVKAAENDVAPIQPAHGEISGVIANSFRRWAKPRVGFGLHAEVSKRNGRT
ncbi:MAG: hypothetical protein WAN65_07845 [Candidatus Sulfotelmatobacter sp.]